MNIIELVINSSWQQVFNTFPTLLCEETDHFNGYLKPQDVSNTEKASM